MQQKLENVLDTSKIAGILAMGFGDSFLILQKIGADKGLKSTLHTLQNTNRRLRGSGVTCFSAGLSEDFKLTNRTRRNWAG